MAVDDDYPDSFTPQDEADFDEELAAAEDAAVSDAPLTLDDDPDLVLADEVPPPPGRSWAFDFAEGTSLLGDARGPLETRGDATLRGWIEKCLNTDRGAHPIHPPDYGMAGLYDMIGEPALAGVEGDLEDRLRDALIFHPNISDVTDFDAFVGTVEDDDEDVLYVSFTVVTEDGDEQTFDAVPLGAGA